MSCSFYNDLTLPLPCIGRRRAGATLSPRLCSSPRSLSFYDLSPPSTYTGRLARSCAGSIWKVDMCGCVCAVSMLGDQALPLPCLSPVHKLLSPNLSLPQFVSLALLPHDPEPDDDVHKEQDVGKEDRTGHVGLEEAFPGGEPVE